MLLSIAASNYFIVTSNIFFKTFKKCGAPIEDIWKNMLGSGINVLLDTRPKTLCNIVICS